MIPCIHTPTNFTSAITSHRNVCLKNGMTNAVVGTVWSKW